MEKLKHVLSPGSKKTADATHEGDHPHGNTAGPTGQGSHLAGTNAGAEETHPIYDQMTGKSPTAPTSDDPTRTSGQPPHFSNTTNLDKTPPVTANTYGGQQVGSTPTSSQGPIAATSTHRGTVSGGASTASIKSGVMGFPQDHTSHAALDTHHNLDATQAQGAGLPDRSGTGELNTGSSLGRDTAIGAGSAGVAHQLHHQPDHENLRSSTQQSRPVDPATERSAEKDFAKSGTTASQQPFEQSFEQPTLTTDTDRSFPLAGGVTSRKQANDPVTHTSHVPATTTSEREPGTKDKVTGVHDGHGREKLAGAAAVAAGTGAYSATRRSEHDDREIERERASKGNSALTGVTGTHTTSPDALRSEHELRSGHHHGPDETNRNVLGGTTLGTTTASPSLPQSERNITSSAGAPLSSTQTQGHGNHNREALAAATTAAAIHSTGSPSHSKVNHDHAGHGHTFSGDPCLSEDKPHARVMTDGPHLTDTANRMDPSLHVPGSFPETPLETPRDQKTGAGGYISGPSGRQSETLSTGQPGVPTSVGGHSATSKQQETLPIDSTSTGHGNDSQHSYGRDAALAGGLGAAGLGTYAAGQHHQKGPTDVEQSAVPADASPYSSAKLDPRVNPNAPKVEEQRFDPTARSEPSHHTGNVQALGSQRESNPLLAQNQDGNKDHHYGRDAGLVGAGAATAGGAAYLASQREGEPRSGPASSTVGPHESNTANVLDPRVQPDPALQKHHQAASTSQDPASKTIGPHKSNIANVLDPRVQPEPEKQKGHSTIGPHQSDALNRLDPKVDTKAQPQDHQHHYGRDAAVVGGTGAAGYGAYEAAKGYDEHRSTQPSASLTEQRYDPTAPGTHHPSAGAPSAQTQDKQHHYGRDAAMLGGTGAAGYGAHEALKGHGDHQNVQPAAGSNSQPLDTTTSRAHEPGAHNVQHPTEDRQHHYGRDGAVAGGLGAAGVGAYAASKHRDGTTQPAVSQDYPTSHGVQQQPYGSQAQQPHTSQGVQQPHTFQTQDPNAAHQRFDSAQDPSQQQHHKRDAAAIGAAGAVGAGGAYAYSQRDAEKAEKEHLAQEKAQQKAQEKELEHQRKEHQKEIDHQRKEQQKEADHQRKEQQKEIDHKRKEEQKALEHKQKEEEKHLAKEQKHHDKVIAAEEKERQKEAEKEQERQQREAAKAGEREEDEGKEKKHHLFGFLHRDKSKKEKGDRSAESSPRQSRDLTTAGAAGATGAGGLAAHEAGQDSDTSEGRKHRNKLHKDPPKGHPAREALEHSKDRDVNDPDNRVIEPNTGLPMNVAKYGDGAGGTDGSTTVGGYKPDVHNHPEGQLEGQRGTVTDSAGLGKSNTPY